MSSLFHLTLRITAVVCLAIGLTACGDGGGGGQTSTTTEFTPLKLASVVMPTGAQGAILTGSASSSPTGGTTSPDNTVTLKADAMYMVNQLGSLEEVDYVDDAGNSLRNDLIPQRVIDINANWLFMHFVHYTLATGAADNYEYLVEKSTGRAFYLPSPLPCDSMNGCPQGVVAATSTDFKTADNGDIFVKLADGFVYRIAISGMTDRTLTAVQVTLTDGILQFDITSDSSLLAYHGHDSSGNHVMRAVSVANGAITNIGPILSQYGLSPPLLGGQTFTWEAFIRALDGKLYTRANDSAGMPHYVELFLDSSGVVQANVTPVGGNTANFSWPYATEAPQRHVVGGKLIYFGYGLGPRYLHEINPPGGNAGILSSPVTARKTVFTANYIFEFGFNPTTQLYEIYRIDPQTYTAVNLPISNAYDITDMAVLTADTVWFQGLRLADAATVIGEADMNGNVTIKDVIGAAEPQVLTLIPVNAVNFIAVDGSALDWSNSFLQITDGTADTTGNSATDIVDIMATSDGVRLYFAVSVNGALDALQGQGDIAANTTATFTPEVQLKLSLTPKYSVRLGPSGIFIFDEQLFTSTAAGVGVIGNNLFEGSIPLSSIGSPTAIALDGAIGWASADGTLFTSYDTTTSTSLPLQ